MPEARKYDLLNLGGGYIDAVPATHLQDSQFQGLLNFYAKNYRLVRRKGVRFIGDAFSAAGPGFGTITGIFQLRKRDGTDKIILLGSQKASAYDGTAFTPIPVTAAVNPNVVDRWTGEQYKEVIVAARKGAGLVRCPGDVVMRAGIEAPTGAPVIADGGPGNLAAGNYQIVYTNINLDTLQESNPSPVSNTLLLAANRSISVTSIGASTNPQVNARRIYRTLVNQQGEYFKSGDLAGAASTGPYLDNVAQDDLGGPASFANGLPPDNIKVFIVWKDRGVATDGRDVFLSEFGLMESYDEDLTLQVFPDDGHAVVGLHAWGDRAVIGKSNKILLLTGTDRASFAIEVLTDRAGLASHHSMRSVEGSLFWYSGDKILRSDGVGVDDISDRTVKAILSTIPTADREKVCAGVVPKNNWYVLSIPTADVVIQGETCNALYLVYDYRAGVWQTFAHRIVNPDDPTTDIVCPAASFIAEVFTGDGRQQKLYCAAGPLTILSNRFNGLNNFLLELFADSANTDDFGPLPGIPFQTGPPRNSPIRAVARTKEFGLEDQGLLKWLRRVWLNCTSTTAGLTLRAYRDSTAVAIKVRTFVTLYGLAPWKRFGLSTLGLPGSTFSVEVEYSGEPEFELVGISLEAVAAPRARRAL